MSKISAGECSCMDMQWYGVDRQGNIAVFCSAGEANIPEFVCENVERAEELIDFFENIQYITDSILLFKQTKRAEEVARDFSNKGLFYFDSDDGTKYGICTLHEYYTKLSYPKNPLKYELLPENIKKILHHNFLEINDFSIEKEVRVKHAYGL